MIAFRKPFTVGIFEGVLVWGMDYKILLVTSQLLGYMLAKFAGIKFISEITRPKRAVTLILMIVIAEVSLILFGNTPVPYNLIFMFINGIPLGMVWGLVFSYLEGRKNTEILGVGLSLSFIVATGFVKSIGQLVKNNWGFSEFQLPYITGLLFLLPYFLFVLMLNNIPNPSAEDEEYKTKRIPMTKADRKNFFFRFAPGLIILTVTYMFITGYRDYRDYFIADIWKSLGFGNQPSVFTTTEIYVALGVLFVLAFIVFFKKNIYALIVNHIFVLLGLLTVGVGTILFTKGIISPYIWMVLNGFGGFMCYVPFNCLIFDRLIATFKHESNSGFLIYFADSFGYLASISIMLYKNFFASSESKLQFFIFFSYIFSITGMVLITASIIYFVKKKKKDLSM